MLIFDGLSGLLLGGTSALGTGIRDGFKNQYSKDAASARGEETYIDADGKERLVKNNHRVGELIDRYTNDRVIVDLDRNCKVIKNCTLEYIDKERDKRKREAIEKGEKYYTLCSNSAIWHEEYKNVKGDKYYSVDNDEMYVIRRIDRHNYFMNVKDRTIGDRYITDLDRDCSFYNQPPTETEIEWIKKWNYAVSKLGYYQGDYLNDMAGAGISKQGDGYMYDHEYSYVFLVDIKED